MSDKHLFVNFSHYQDRPDPNMRQRIASHAARYGPNGSLAFKAPRSGTECGAECSSSAANSRHSPRPCPSTSTSTRRTSSATSVRRDTVLMRDYDAMVSRFGELCACREVTQQNSSKSKGSVVHSEECSLLEDYFDLCSQHELPFRVFNSPETPFTSLPASLGEGLVTLCLMVAAQATIDGIDPNFKGKPSKETLTLQQKALASMQKVIKSRPTTVDDSLVLGSAILMSIAAYFDETEAYKAHKSSLQKLIDHQGGLNQTKAHRIVKTITACAEVCLALNRYMSTPKPPASIKKGPPQFPAHAPLKLKYPMPPFANEATKAINRMNQGFQVLASASKLSVQALQLIEIAEKWSLLIDQPLNSETDQKQLLADTAGANARLLDLYTESVDTQRLGVLLLASLPVDGAHMKLERCICLGFTNLLHSMSLWQYPVPVRNRLATDFTESIFSLAPKDEDEEDAMIWLALAVASEWRHCAAKLKTSPVIARHGYDPTALGQTWLQQSKQLMDWLIVKCERARTWEDVAKICARFLWLRRLNGEWKVTWKEAMERRLSNMPRKKSRHSP